MRPQLPCIDTAALRFRSILLWARIPAALLGILFCFAFFPAPVRAQSYSFPAQSPVGSTSTSVTVTVRIRHAGTVNSIAVGGQGKQGVDFSASSSGTCSAGVAYPVGQTCTVGVVFSPLYPGVRTGAVVLTSSGGAVLGTVSLSGVGTGGIGVALPGFMDTVAGHAAWIYNGDGENAPDAAIFLPFGIALDSAGNLYIADQGNNRVREVAATTTIISTIAGNGVLGGTGDGGPATSAMLSSPSSIAIDGAGNVYIGDTGNDAIRMISATTGVISTVAGTIGQPGYSGDGGPATSATLSAPNGIAVDTAGNLYIADSANNVVRRVDALSGIITTVAGNGTGSFSGDGGPATSATLDTPWSITPAPGGLLYIADQANNRIRMVDAGGIITTVAGNGIPQFAGDGGQALKAAITTPASVVIDVAGNMYIADSGNNRIRKVAFGTGIINTIAGNDTQSLVGDTGPANQAGLYGPYAMAPDGLGNLYIADVFHNRVREVVANEAVLFFQPMRVNRTSQSQQQLYENDGNAVLNVLSTQAVSNSAVDATSTTCVSGLALTPVTTCELGGSLAPTILGTPVVGTVWLTSDAVNSQDVLWLSGNVLDEDPSTITLTSGTNPAIVGSVIVFTATVTSGGVTPTGLVTLLDGTNAIGSAALGASGTATFNVGTLTAGQHSMTVSYAGDTNNAASSSTILVETVKPLVAETQTSLTANTNVVLAGVPVVLTATVTVTTTGTGNGPVTGTVTFTDGGTTVGAVAVANGAAMLTLSNLAVGRHTVTATFTSGSSFDGSAAAPLSLTVQSGTTATALSSSSNPSLGGGAPLLTASVASNGSVPTGNVSFMDGATPLGTAALNAGGQATLSASGLAVGSHNIVATYAGDMNDNGSVSNVLVQIVNVATTTGIVGSSLNPAPQGSPLVLTARIISNGGIPTGTVEFFDGTVSLGTGTLDKTGSASLTTATLALGLHSIEVTYKGDALDSGSTSSAFTQTIVPATTKVTLTSSANPATFGSPLTFSVQVLGTGAQPTGSVTLTDGSASLGTQPVDAAGNASFVVAAMTIGVHNLVAVYSGDADHAQNNVSLSQRVVQVTTISLGSSAPNGIAGTLITWTAVVTGTNNQPLTGTVAFKENVNTLATAALDATGTATFSSAGLAIGSHTLTATYSGDTLDQTSISIPLVQTIQLATTTTALTSSANPVMAGSILTLNASVTGNGSRPTGSIVFSDGVTSLGSVPVSSTGSASMSLTTLAPGIHALAASYSGDADNAPSASSALTQQVVQHTVLSIASSANPSTFSSSVTITLSVSGSLAATPATGMVSLSDGSTSLGTAALDSNQSARFTLTSLALGQHTLEATYAGDTNNSPAVAPAFTQTVILRPTTTSLSSSLTSLSSGQPVTFVAIVQGAGPQIPTGTVSFAVGSTILGSAPLNAAGLAILTVDPPQGTDPVVAEYPGDTLFAASNSAADSLVVGPTIEFTMTSTPSAVSVQSGDHTTLQVSLTSAVTFNDTIDLGCAGLPYGATCTFSQTQLKAAGGGTQNFSIVLDTTNPLGSGAAVSRNNGGTGRGSAVVLACLLPGGLFLSLLCRRSRRRFAGLIMLLLAGTMLVGLSGCGNSLSTVSTPAGAYTFRIVATGATTGATESTSVALTVTN